MSSFFGLLIVSILFAVAFGDVMTMIPLQKEGHAFHRGNLASKTVVEFYLDLGCSSCMSEWPVLRKVYESYKDRVHFLYRIFPLPYHQQAFIQAKAAQVVNYYGAEEAVFTFINTNFAQQSKIYNSATADMTYNDVVKFVAQWATDGTGVTEDQYFTGMNTSTSIGSTLEMNARYMWKYSTIQGDFATPFFAIDGLKVGGLETYQDWASVLDPLVN